MEKQWISVKHALPTDTKPVLGLLSMNAPCIVSYTNGRQIQAELEESTGEEYLKPGFYEEAEQLAGYYDFSYIHRDVTHWMPIPKLT